MPTPQFVHLIPPPGPTWTYHGGPVVTPALPQACVDALVTLCAGGGAPRWAAVGWAVDLVGPWRSLPRVGSGGSLVLPDLLTLVQRLDPAPAREVLPGWLRAGSGDVDTLLELGQAVGKPGRTWAVDVPRSLAPQVISVGEAEDGLVRFKHPCWTGDPLTSDVRLAALGVLARWRSGAERAAVRELVSWCAGLGRADVGTFPRSVPRFALRGETTSPGASASRRELEGTDPDALLSALTRS